ncbi:MAG: RNA polymerase sigma factor, partial [Anaerolineae bacterium]
MGQADDYAELYREYLPRILNYVRSRVASEDLAQDLTAAVFERAIAKQHTLRKREAFGAWLFAIARNAVAGYYRKRRPVLSLELAADEPASNPSPPEAAARREELDRMQAALAALPERDEEV